MLIEFKLSEMLSANKMTQRALSQKTGIRPNTISALVHGTIKRLEIEHLDRICEMLGCQPGELFEYTEEGMDQHVSQTCASAKLHE